MAKNRTRLLRTARRRWGSARVIAGGRRPPRRKTRRRKLPGTAMERTLVQRLVGRSLPPEQLADAIRFLRAGAKLKELEINERLETLLED
jgi:hypothetical protein